MKKLLAAFYIVIFLVTCSKDKETKKVIAPDKLYNLLIDMHLADASLDNTYQTDSLLMKAKSKYNYIFDKHETDSATFVYNLDYYTRNKSKELTQIYTKVVDSLERFREQLTKTSVSFSVPFHSKYPDSIYYNIRIPYKIDSLLLKSRSKIDVQKDTLATAVNIAVANTLKKNGIDSVKRKRLRRMQ